MSACDSKRTKKTNDEKNRKKRF